MILIGNNGFSTTTGVVDHNVITATQTSGGGNGIAGGNGVAGAGNVWTPDLTLSVTNNTISGTNGNGILLVGRGTSGIARFKIASNNVGASNNAGGTAREGIRVALAARQTDKLAALCKETGATAFACRASSEVR